MLTINNTTIPTPSAMRISLIEVGDSSRRNAAGELVIDRCALKRRLQPGWNILSAADASALLAAVSGQPFFTLAYPDPITGSTRTVQCTCSAMDTGILRMEQGAPVWQGIEMTWIER